jgi:enterochelin esterase-like enzyme
MNKINTYLLLIFMVVIASCHSKIKERKDEVYSRHLQKHISLTVISTPVPTNKSDLNLLLLNDGQDVEKLRVKEIVDSLYRKNLIQPLIIVGISAFDREQEYGVAGRTDDNGNGASAEKYAGFITGELLPFIKKKAAVRKFNSVTIAGSELGGLSAFDVAWENGDKINKVGVFSGSFDVTNKKENQTDSSAENRIIINKIRSSRKRPHLQFWFYAAGNETNNTKDLINLIENKNFVNSGDITFLEEKNGSNDYESRSHVFPQFLLWAEGK